MVCGKEADTHPLSLPETDDPAEDEEIVGDPYKTLFVGRLPFAITESDLRREFEMYGPLERIRLVRNKDGKSRGYAFLVYEREKDMKGEHLSLFQLCSNYSFTNDPLLMNTNTAAYKDADGLKLLNRRVLIDVERGRTVKGWRPRRLGGGLGGRPKPLPPGKITPLYHTYIALTNTPLSCSYR